MTSPEKILKGLRCCSGPKDQCKECPYKDPAENKRICFIQVRLDAIHLIERLQARIAELEQEKS